jgi:hypothetical protein
MTEIADVMQGTIDQMLTRIDSLAAKLGIAATQVWGFTVKAKLVDARRELIKSAALLALPIFLLCWTLHIATMHIPHERKTEMAYKSEYRPCDQVAVVDGKQQVMHEQCQMQSQEPHEIEGDISSVGFILIASGVAALIAAFAFAASGIGGIIDALADSKTAEYDAFQDLLSDLT